MPVDRRTARLILPLVCMLAAGCASTGLNSARVSFYQGDMGAALKSLEGAGGTRRHDGVLLLMERGSVRQAGGHHAAAAWDWIAAAALAEDLDYYSASQGSASFVVNDRVKSFRGTPYERTLLHTFAASSFLVLGDWDDAAVEARNVVARLEHLEGFPDDPYSHYVAGFCFEMINDRDGARIEYEKADALLPELTVDAGTGLIAPSGGTPARTEGHELVCFISIGRQPPEHGVAPGAHRWGPAPYAEIYADGVCLGRSCSLVDAGSLLAATERRLAALRAAKTVSRVVIKETLAQAVESENELLGEILRLILFSLEVPDTRRWECLPYWLHVARVPCPAGLTTFTVVFRSTGGAEMARQVVAGPLARRGSTLVSLCRDLSIKSAATPPTAGPPPPAQP